MGTIRKYLLIVYVSTFFNKLFVCYHPALIAAFRRSIVGEGIVKYKRALREHPLNHYIVGKFSFFQPRGGSGNRKSPG